MKLDKKTWSIKRIDLNNTYELNSNWVEVIELFKKRIIDFYFEPIESILKPNMRKGEGFAIVTLHCALIEMLAAFKYGMIHNREKKKYSYEYKDSSEYFIKFLKTEALFENYFFIINKRGIKNGNKPFKAEEFYDCVRCGLMHEARTKKNWLITAKELPISKQLFIRENEEGNIEIHRTNLHFAIKNYFNTIYIPNLQQNSDEGRKLRRFLARKLDHLHDIEMDISFDWWEDR